MVTYFDYCSLQAVQTLDIGRPNPLVIGVLGILLSRCFKHSAAINWNDLPYDIRACDSVNAFKRKLKTHLFNLAYHT